MVFPSVESHFERGVHNFSVRGRSKVSSLGSCARVTRLRNVPTHRNVPKGTPFYLYLSRVISAFNGTMSILPCPSSLDIEMKDGQILYYSPPGSNDQFEFSRFSPRSRKIRIQLRMWDRIGGICSMLLGKGINVVVKAK